MLQPCSHNYDICQFAKEGTCSCSKMSRPSLLSCSVSKAVVQRPCCGIARRTLRMRPVRTSQLFQKDRLASAVARQRWNVHESDRTAKPGNQPNKLGALVTCAVTNTTLLSSLEHNAQHKKTMCTYVIMCNNGQRASTVSDPPDINYTTFAWIHQKFKSTTMTVPWTTWVIQ
jgi:hypothetical protein